MNQEKVMDLVRADFGEGWMAKEATWKAVVLIPKGGVLLWHRTRGGGVEGSGGDS